MYKKVHISRLFFILLTAFLLSFSADIFAMGAPCVGPITANTVASGIWEDGGSWDQGGCYPDGATQNVNIAGYSITSTTDLNVGNLIVSSTGVLTVNGKQVTVNGNLQVDGSVVLSRGDIVLAGSGITISGTGTITSGGGSGDLYINGNASIASSTDLFINLESGNNLQLGSGVAITNNGQIMVDANVVGVLATSTWNNAAGSILKIGSNFLSTGTLVASSSNNSVVYYGSAAQNIKDPSTSTYYNLTTTGTGLKTQLSNLIINGSFDISGGTYDCNDFSLSVKSNFSTTGTFTDGTGVNAYTITFSGSSGQNYSNSAGNIFANITVDKASGDLYLGSNLQINKMLTMNSGNVVCGSSKVILGTDVANEGTLSYSSGQIIGKCERYIGSGSTGVEYIFPVGNASNYRSARPIFNSISTGGSLIAEFIASSPGALDPVPTVDGSTNVYNTFPDGYWKITVANGFSSSNYNLSLDGNGFSGFSIVASTRLLTRANSSLPWTPNGTHVDASGYTANRSGISTLSAEYCFADCTPCDPPETSAISGDNNVCIDETGVAYSVVNTSGSTYEWTITGGTVASGQGTNSITVNWGSVGSASGNVRVVETNLCTSGTPIDFAVSILPIDPSGISGKVAVPVGATGIVYSVTDLGYTYTWNITGGTIASGQGTSSITVDWGSEGTGNVSVVASDPTCGAGTSVDMDVYIYIIVNSATSGPWDTPSTWDCNCVPLSTDNVRILAGHSISMSSQNPLVVNNFTIDATGIMNSSGRPFVINGDFTVDGQLVNTTSKSVTVSGNGNTIDGSGTIDLTGGADFIFASGNKTIASSASLTITANSVSINSSGITVSNNGAVVMNCALTGAGVTSVWTNQSGSSLTISGALLATGTLNASSTNNTVHYNSTSALNIKTPSSGSYYNLSLSGASIKTQQGSIIVGGDLAINAGTLASNNFNISIGGNWSNSGTYTPGSGTVTFNGTTQSITKATGEAFYNLTINMSSGVLTLNNNIGISGTLTMTAGNINTGANRITLGTGTATPGTLSYSSGRIIGEFQRWVNTTLTNYLFPIGSISNYNPAVLNFTNLSSGSVICKFVESDPGSTGLPVNEDGLDITNQYSDGYWSVTAANGCSSSDYSLVFTGTGFSSYTINSATRIITRSTGGSWVLDGTHSNAVPPVCYRNNLVGGISTSGTEFGFGQTNCPEFSCSAITGNSDACTGSVEAYSVTDVIGHTYNWVVTQGTINSGQGTSSISVTWDATASLTAKVEVTESSGCYSAPVVSKTVTLHSLETSTISGPTTVSENTLQGPYTISQRTGYSYTWSVPTGNGSVSSGQGTSTVNILWGSVGAATLRVVGQYGSCTAAANVDLPVSIVGAIASVMSGAWNNPATWGGSAPGSGDNAKISSGHTVTITADATIADLQIESGATLTHNAGVQITVTGNYINNGVHNSGNDNILLAASGSGKTASGTGTINNCALLSISGNSRTIMSGTSLIINNTATGTVNVAASITTTNNGAITITGDLTGGNSSSRWINATGSTLTVGGDAMATGILTASGSNNLVKYNGSSAQAIKGTTYYNLSLENAGKKTMSGSVDINGNLTILSGELDVSAGNYTINLAGNWTNNGVFTCQSGTVIFDGTNTIDASSTQVFYNFVNNGSGITVLADNAITVIGSTTNNSNITLKSPLTENPSASWIDNGISGGGTFTVERYVTSGRWWYVSTPISNGTSAIYNAAAANNYLYHWNEPDGYHAINDNSTALGSLKGYCFFTTGASTTLAHTGSIHTGILSVSTTKTEGSPMQGYYMLSNPYPSAIDWDAASGWTRTNIRNIVYIRKNGSWATYNGDSGVGTNGGSRYIASMQSIWVKDTVNGGNVTMNNSVRVHDLSTTIKSNKTSLSNILRLKVDKGSGETDEAVIYFTQGAMSTYDKKDTEKTFGTTSIPHLYMTSGSTMLAVNSLPDSLLLSEMIIPVSFKVSIAGTFMINASEVSSFDPEIGIYLKDLLIGYTVDLRQVSNYVFSSEAVDTDSRFQIVFKPSESSVELISFRANARDNDILATWVSGTAKSYSSFTLEKSIDGVDFTEVSIINDGIGSDMKYEVVDPNPYLGVSYYRLKQTDLNGNVTFSDIIPVSYNLPLISGFNIYPKPADDKVLIDISNAGEGSIYISLVGQEGNVVKEFKFNSENRNFSKMLDISELIPGMYMVVIQVGDRVLKDKLVVR